MNCFLIIISILIPIVTSSAVLNTGNQKEGKSFVEIFATLLGLLSFRAVATVISPLILKFALLPMFFILKIISKPLMMIGLTGYLMVAFTPLILAKSGMTSPVFESRSQSDGMFSTISRVMSTNMSMVLTETMDFFNLNNDECKQEISCRLGKRIANYVPYIKYIVTQSGAGNWIENDFMANTVRYMTEAKDCPELCQSLSSAHNKQYSSATYSSDPTDPSMFEWLG